MGSVGRLSHHVLVPRRRGTRRRSVLKRHHGHWAVSSYGHQRDDDAPASSEVSSNQAALTPIASIEAPRPPSVLDMPLATLTWSDPWRWLKLGWSDFQRAPTIGLFYGACFMVMGWALLKVYEAAPAYVMALSAGLFSLRASRAALS